MSGVIAAFMLCAALTTSLPTASSSRQLSQTA
jgi:hypothetical protein